MRLWPHLVLTFLLLLAAPARADEMDILRPEVQAAEKYLDGITTLKARFVQTSNDGRQLAGNFFMKRPGRMRFEYDPPVTDLIIADGTFVYYYDGEMKQQSNTLITKSLANFFLREHLRLSGDIDISQVQQDGKELNITLTQSRDPLAGTLTLSFYKQPLSLKSWQVVDAQGLVTTIELTQLETGVALKDKLFQYADPSKKTPVYNQN